VLVYHGSYAPIEEINLEKCRPYTDFGKGFYVTKFKRHAERLYHGSKVYGNKELFTIFILDLHSMEKIMALPTKEEYENMDLEKRKDIFKEFLRNGPVKNDRGAYTRAINGSNKFIDENFFTYIDSEIFNKKFADIKESEEYEKIQKDSGGHFNSAMKKYTEFLKEISSDKKLKGASMCKEIQLLEAKRNLILTGAPGTGKTYKTAEIALAILGEDISDISRIDLMTKYRKAIKDGYIAFTTFHQSMDYEEFVEGLKPDIDENTKQGTGTYSVKNGIFKDICKRAEEKSSMNSLNEAIEELKAECFDNIIKVKNRSDYEFSVTYRGGKTFWVRSDKSEMEEGKEQVVNIDAIKKIYQGIKGGPGIYNKTYLRGILEYLKNKYDVQSYQEDKSNENYVLIIDEINRGNVSKIFGELITLLEKDKRFGETNAIEVTLPYSQDKFSVPNNLYIIGTMNTADRSIGHIDYAIRRRFVFCSIKSDEKVIKNHDKYKGNTREKALTLFSDIKSFIEKNINADLSIEDLMIGHSYFLCETIEELKARLEYEIIPLVEEYNKDGIITVEKEILKEDFDKWRSNI
jgi:5-methylcytosine-specific restriction protein B